MKRLLSIVRNPRLLVVLVLMGLGIGCGQQGTTPSNSSGPPTETPAQLAATAPSTELSKSNQSAHFTEVSKHLDLGGSFYAYVDIDGDLEGLSDKLNDVYAEISETGEMPGADIAGIVSELGFNGIQAIGASSYATETGFRNKAFLYIPGGRSGLMNLLGGDAEPLHYGGLAPAGTDLVFEQEINLKALRETADKIVAKIDDPDVEEPFNEILEEEVADLKFTIAELLGNTNGRIMVVARIVKDQPLPLPPDAPEIPSIDLVLAVENASWLFDKLKENFITEGEGPFDFESGGGFDKMLMQVPPDGEMGIYEPLIALEKKTGRVFLASRQSFLDECLGEGARITSDPEFVASIDGLPTVGNSFSYASPEVFSTIQEVIKEAMGANIPQPGQGGPPVPFSAMESFFTSFMPVLENIGIASVGQNLPNGIFYVSNSPDSHKQTLASMAVMPVAMIAGAAVPMYMMQSQQQAAMMEMQMDQALGQPGEPFPGQQATQVEVIGAEGEFNQNVAKLKLRQTHAALVEYAHENDGKFPDSLRGIKADQLDPANLSIKDELTGQSKNLVYLSGRTVDSPDDAVLLATPWPVEGERLVIRLDGTSGTMQEDEFELERISSQQ